MAHTYMPLQSNAVVFADKEDLQFFMCLLLCLRHNCLTSLKWADERRLNMKEVFGRSKRGGQSFGRFACGIQKQRKIAEKTKNI